MEKKKTKKTIASPQITLLWKENCCYSAFDSTFSDLYSLWSGTVYRCVFNLCVFQPSLWLTPTTPAQQFEAEGSWQTQKGFWDMQPYEFFIHSPPPTLASSRRSLPLSLTSIVSCSHHASTPASPLNGGQTKECVHSNRHTFTLAQTQHIASRQSKQLLQHSARSSTFQFLSFFLDGGSLILVMFTQYRLPHSKSSLF